LKLFVEGKLTQWSQFWMTKYNVLTAAVQFLYDFRTQAITRLNDIEAEMGNLMGAASSPTLSRGTFEVADSANLDLRAIVGTPTETELATALFSLHALTPEQGTYAFKLLGGLVKFNNNGTVETFDEKDTLYIKVESDSVGNTYTVSNKSVANSPTITVTDLNVADPNGLLELSPAFLQDLFPQ
jgi:hypothetical protein